MGRTIQCKQICGVVRDGLFSHTLELKREWSACPALMHVLKAASFDSHNNEFGEPWSGTQSSDVYQN